MHQAIDEYQKTTGQNTLDTDTLFLVQYAMPVSAMEMCVIWNRMHSFKYDFGVKLFDRSIVKPLKVEYDASKWINSYSPEFKKWVETADTASYNKFGKQSSIIDGAYVAFIVATKFNGHWHFISSGSYNNTIHKK